MPKKTIAVDFDGVLHSYTTPWQGPEIIPDPPVPGAIDWLKERLLDCNVYIFSTRAQNQYGQFAVREWLKSNGVDVTRILAITNIKVAADLYIDDRAYRFTGNNYPDLETIESLKPWYK